MNRHPWTDEDINQLRALVACGSKLKIIAQVMGRTFFAVKAKIGYCNLSTRVGRHAVWTSENKELLRQYADKGATATFAAARLGMTRNAVLGQAHRMGVQFRGKPAARSTSPRPRNPKVRVIPANATTLLEQTLTELTNHVDTLHVMEEVVALKSSQCRWPCGDLGSEHFKFCVSKKAGPKVPYCSEHLARAWRDGGYAETAVPVVNT